MSRAATVLYMSAAPVRMIQCSGYGSLAKRLWRGMRLSLSSDTPGASAVS